MSAQPRVAQPSGLSSRFWRWAASYTASSMPSAMAPIAFSLATVAASNSFNVGAAMMASMTLGQVVFAVPLSKLGLSTSGLGGRLSFTAYLRSMLAGRALFFITLTSALVLGAQPAVLVLLAGASGVFNGAIYGYYRTLLNGVVDSEQVPRALALTATSTEIIFVSGPVVAALLGTVWSTLPLVAMSLCALVPIAVFPRAAVPASTPPVRRHSLSPALAIWCFCQLAVATAVGGIEVGAVTLAIEFGLAPTSAVLLTVALCIASVTGGAVITLSNRVPSGTGVYALIAVMGLSALAVAVTTATTASPSAVWLVVGAAAALGVCLAPLETFLSIAAEKVLPLSRRADGFSVLRTASGIGFLTASTLLAVTSSTVTFFVGAALLAAALVLAIFTSAYVHAQAVETAPTSTDNRVEHMQ